jgi:hypothetical protein
MPQVAMRWPFQDFIQIVVPSFRCWPKYWQVHVSLARAAGISAKSRNVVRRIKRIKRGYAQSTFGGKFAASIALPRPNPAQ